MRAICFYHSADLDGICSAAIVKYAMPGVELYGINYGEPFPWDLVETDPKRSVVMVDWHIQSAGADPFADMVKLDQVSDLTWIDHHKSAIEDSVASHEVTGRHPFNPGGIRQVGKAACELCWYHFVGEPRNRAVYLLGRYDVWDHSDPDTMPFQCGARMMLGGPEDPQWRELFEGNANLEGQILNNGRLLLENENIQNAKTAAACCFEAYFEGRNVLAVNRGLINSNFFKSVWDPERYELMLGFYFTAKGFWRVTLWSTRDDVDCAALAQEHGGGGHKGAAGFQCTEVHIERSQGLTQIYLDGWSR